MDWTNMEQLVNFVWRSASLVLWFALIGLSLGGGIHLIRNPEKFQSNARANRPRFWKWIPIYNIIWAWIDNPLYVPVARLIGVMLVAIGVFVIGWTCSVAK
jgi:hypothetical protein